MKKEGVLVLLSNPPTPSDFAIGHTWCTYTAPVDDSAWEMLADFVDVSLLHDFAEKHATGYLTCLPEEDEGFDYTYFEEIWMGADFEIEDDIIDGHFIYEGGAVVEIRLHHDDEMYPLYWEGEHCSPDAEMVTTNANTFKQLELAHLQGQVVDVFYHVAMTIPYYVNQRLMGLGTSVLRVPT